MTEGERRRAYGWVASAGRGPEDAEEELRSINLKPPGLAEIGDGCGRRRRYWNRRRDASKSRSKMWSKSKSKSKSRSGSKSYWKRKGEEEGTESQLRYRVLSYID